MAVFVSISSLRRDLLAAESGALGKRGRFELEVALAAMSAYQVAMNSLGFQNIYRLFNLHPQVRCERVFRFGSSAGEPGAWLSLESGRSPANFDVLAVSLPYEQDCLALPSLLKDSGLPLLAAERWQGMPLVFAGGPVITGNPEPVAPFVDVCGIGDGELLVPEFIETWLRAREARLDRERLLEDLAGKPGFYVPALYTVTYDRSGAPLDIQPVGKRAPSRVQRQVSPLDGGPVHSVVVSPKTHFGRMFMVEVARGCRWGCRFCLVCSINRPYRQVDTERILQTLELCPPRSQAVGLVGANLCDHSGLEEIVRRVRGMGLRLGVSSLRPETVTPRLLGLLRDCAVKTVTLAPEVATDSLMDCIGKRCDAGKLFELVETIGALGFEQLKLYYLIGLPGETQDDRQALLDQVLRLRGILPASTGLTVSVNPFIPKPRTPFQDQPMAARTELKAAFRQLRQGFARTKRTIHLQAGGITESMAQGVISVGGRQLARAIEISALQGQRFLDALRGEGLDAERILAQKKEPGAIHPWRVLEQDP